MASGGSQEATTRGKHAGIAQRGMGEEGNHHAGAMYNLGAVGKRTGNTGTTVGDVRAVRGRLRGGAGAEKRATGTRVVGGKKAIGASNLSSERSKNAAKSDSYCWISGPSKLEPATADRKFAISGT